MCATSRRPRGLCPRRPRRPRTASRLASRRGHTHRRRHRLRRRRLHGQSPRQCNFSAIGPVSVWTPSSCMARPLRRRHRRRGRRRLHRAALCGKHGLAPPLWSAARLRRGSRPQHTRRELPSRARRANAAPPGGRLGPERHRLSPPGRRRAAQRRGLARGHAVPDGVPPRPPRRRRPNLVVGNALRRRRERGTHRAGATRL